MSNDLLWNHDEPVRELGIAIPRWIERDVSAADVAAIIQGGCASGAYMPAVTYHQALATMNEHGDDIFDFIQDIYGAVPHNLPGATETWAGLAVHFVSLAVELWAGSVEDEIRAALEERAEEEEEDEEDE